jgi:hypothetical protein
MPERVLNLQLNGGEVIEAVLDEIRTQLHKSCYLNPNSAYDFMAAKVRIDLELHDTGMVITETFTAESDTGAKPVDPDATEVHEVEFDIEPAPPNEVRVQTGQPVPVQTNDKDGKPVVKHVRYSRKDAKKAAAAAMMLFFCLGIGVAQQKPAPQAHVEQLSASEQIAVQATVEFANKVAAEQNELVQRIRALSDDIVKRHPGYRLNTNNGQLEKIPASEEKKSK